MYMSHFQYIHGLHQKQREKQMTIEKEGERVVLCGVGVEFSSPCRVLESRVGHAARGCWLSAQ